ncbi:PspC domain-containing protein [Corynebacterium frankenforstense]|uniref:PspC domain-containing protein n=1 Tax=Corynebacterium frankenforstense TaxID=1230998 RepID=UPI0009520AE1|nr:PspC domain-containing protein [Corynebacterium frankenforstense]
MDTNTAGELARRIWATRPPRLSGSPGAGVCEGIGVRYRIDPVLVRVLFVVGAFIWVTSVPIYLILWGLMPRYGVPYSPFESLGRPGSDSKDRTAGVLLLIFAVLTSGLLGSSLVDGAALAFLVSLALAGGAIVLLHKRTPVPPPGLVAAQRPVGGDAPVDGGSGDASGDTPGEGRDGTGAVGAGAAGGAGAAPWADLSGYKVAEGWPDPRAGAQRQAPAGDWDPLGAAPYDWRDQGRTDYRAKNPDSTGASYPGDGTGGAQDAPWYADAAVGAGSGASTHYTGADFAGRPGRKRRNWPLIVAGALLGALIGVAGLLLAGGAVFGEDHHAPASEADLRDDYEGGMKALTVDLTDVGPLDEQHTVTVSSGLGPTQVFLPADVPLHLECDEGLGEMDCRPGDYNTGAGGARMTVVVEGGLAPTPTTVAVVSDPPEDRDAD